MKLVCRDLVCSQSCVRSLSAVDLSRNGLSSITELVRSCVVLLCVGLSVVSWRNDHAKAQRKNELKD